MSLELQRLLLTDLRGQINLNDENYLRVYDDKVWWDGGQEQPDWEKSCECVEEIIEAILASETGGANIYTVANILSLSELDRGCWMEILPKFL